MSVFLRFLLSAWLLAMALPAPAQLSASAASVVTSERVRAELVAHAPEGVAPGKPVWLGLQLAHQPGWHTYWKNSGDSGLPTTMQWTLPAGVQAGDIAWPVPRKIPVGSLANYGYEGTVLLPVPLTIGPDFKPSPFGGGDLEVKLTASWLVCKRECIPEDGQFTLKLPLRSTTAMHAQDFQAAFDAQPQPVVGATGVIPASVAKVNAQGIDVEVQGLPVALRGKQLELFPETPEIVEPAGAWTQAWKGAVWTAHLPLSSQRSTTPGQLPVVLAEGSKGWRVDLQVTGTWPPAPVAATAAAGVPPALQDALNANAAKPSTAPIGMAAALLGALLGGLVLNLMPCVFPVLAIKVVGFARHADDRRAHRIAGFAYTAGVVLSFLLLAGLLLALRAGGEQLGWGFQLQSPLVVAGLAVLFTLIALNFAGVFEFGAMLPSSVASMEVRHPVGNAFLSGVLAVAIASPCTAPFMGASLGLAATLPAASALLVFAVLGLGMALPYLAASLVPAVARWLPRPGAWMDIFRKLMAFPMLATVAWLVWVLGQQSGIDGAGALLVLLVVLALLVWTLTLRGRARAVLAAVALIALAATLWTAGPLLVQPAQAATATQAEGEWQPWSQAKVQQLLAAGQPVFVDFTAAWCVTCQVNKKTTLSNPQVLADLKQRKVALLRADWTRRDPAITAALAVLGRNGVPVYALYRAGQPPIVLSELLGVDEVRQAVGRL